MASALTHPVIPCAIAIALGRRRISVPLLLAGCIFSVAPDFDVIAFTFGISYASPFGHRGFTHSIAFAIVVAAIGACFSGQLRARPLTTLLFLFIATVSHPLLDALTNGGLGVALAWPFSDVRMFAPWQPVEVSPIGARRFFSAWGVRVLRSELVWIWAPATVVAMAGWLIRRQLRDRKS